MNRRSLLSAFAPKTKTSAQSFNIEQKALGGGSGLSPYSGVWNYEKAKHLLSRAMFGPNHAQIKQSVADGLNVTITKLFTPTSSPLPPLNPNYTADPACAVGQSWINAAYSQGVDGYRRNSLSGWLMSNIFSEGVSVTEKMTLFWYNHYVTSDINDPRAQYANIKLYRENALGNFREFTKLVTIDHAMLRFLNGNENTKKAPNENYARELLELFTIGKGPLIAPGDYTNYTEDDILQMAKVLTGWKAQTIEGNPSGVIKSVFNSGNHDTTTKTLSPKFNSTQITDGGVNEYKTLIDIIFQQPEVARFISRKLYRYFVYYVIDAEIEANVIQPMADKLLQSNYDIVPAVRALLNSEHFFNDEIGGCMIKPPIDYATSMIKMFSIVMPDASNLNKQYSAWRNIFNTSVALQQFYLGAPSVSGWTPYYQKPSYYQIWINSVTLPIRIRLLEGITTIGITIQGTKIIVDALNFVKQFDDPSDINLLIDDLVKFFYPRPIAQVQKDFFKNSILGGLPDFVWTQVWTDYINFPNDISKKTLAENGVRGLLYVMVDQSEFQLQ